MGKKASTRPLCGSGSWQGVVDDFHQKKKKLLSNLFGERKAWQGRPKQVSGVHRFSCGWLEAVFLVLPSFHVL